MEKETAEVAEADESDPGDSQTGVPRRQRLASWVGRHKIWSVVIVMLILLSAFPIYQYAIYPLLSPIGHGVVVEHLVDISNPTSLTPGENGTIYVSSQNGEVWSFTVENGQARSVKLFHDFEAMTTGVAFILGQLYVSTRGEIYTAADHDGDGDADQVERIVSGLPVGRHQNNGLALGPDGRVYFGLGSTTDGGPEDDERSATIQSMNPDGSDLRIHASGFRNPYDLVFLPSGQLLATTNGQDIPATPDELHLVGNGTHHGFPDGGGQDPVYEFEEHSSADGIAYYDHDHFPYRGDIFVVQFGNWVGASVIGRNILRIQLEPSGDGFRASAEPIVERLDRPTDIIVGPDGELLVTDWGADEVLILTRDS